MKLALKTTFSVILLILALNLNGGVNLSKGDDKLSINSSQPFLLYKRSNSEKVTLTGQYDDSGVDLDDDGLYDLLQISVELNVSEAGEYRLELIVISTESLDLFEPFNQSHWEEGINIVSVSIDAYFLDPLLATNTMYSVRSVKIRDNTSSIIVDTQSYYSTQFYSSTEFDIHSLQIYNNSDLKVLTELRGWSGIGTLLNPYTIEGLIIESASSPFSTISIENTDAFFQISNCSIRGGGMAIALRNVMNGIITENTIMNNQAGIDLWNVRNVEISSNNISGNNIGIVFSNATSISVIKNTIDRNDIGINLGNSNLNSASNNTILKNTISNSFTYSLLVEEGANNNLIMWNDFQNNMQGPFDLGINSSFVGNYWEHWSGPGGYLIPGGVSIDMFPVFSPQHLPPPVIISPKGGDILIDTVLIEWLPINDSLGHPVHYEILYSNDNGNNWVKLAINLTTTFFQWDLRNVSEGTTYLLKIIGTDSLGFFSNDLSDSLFAIQEPPIVQPLISLMVGILILSFVIIFLLVKIQKFG
ncbi:MAG: right-handed parallel beta-helix repeat-containing protein [Candidatus Hodarchaeales archaeon]